MNAGCYTDITNLLRVYSNSHRQSSNTKSKVDFSDSTLELSLLKNQFFSILYFPEFQIEYTSPSINNVLGVSNHDFNLKIFNQLVHPEDLPIVILAAKKLLTYIFQNLSAIDPLKTIAAFDFRLKTENGGYKRLLSQYCLIWKNTDTSEFRVFCYYSDISHFKKGNKIDFEFTNYGHPLELEFPDEELLNMTKLFSARERQVLTLLAQGKNSHEIAEKLYISKNTVDTHRRKMLAKSHLCNTAELVAFAVNNQMI